MDFISMEKKILLGKILLGVVIGAALGLSPLRDCAVLNFLVEITGG